VGIFIAGVVFEPDDYVTAWNSAPDVDLERFIVRWETKEVIPVATAVQDWLKASERIWAWHCRSCFWRAGLFLPLD
jgi:hypothetical protein